MRWPQIERCPICAPIHTPTLYGTALCPPCTAADARGIRQALVLPAAGLLAVARTPILSAMFVVTEADAAAIHDVLERDGELSAVIELRRRFPGITDNVRARACVRTIAGWTPQASSPPKVTRLRQPRRQPGPGRR